MGMFASVGAASALALAAAIAIQLLLAQAARRRVRKLELRPNCLLTRHPILFISGRRSLFYFVNYWNRVPDYLAEHGYEVEVLDLPWRDRRARLSTIRLALKGRQRPCHLIGDSSIEDELKEVLSWKLPSVASVTRVVDEANESKTRPTVADLRPCKDSLETLKIPKASSSFSSIEVTLGLVLLGLHNLICGTGRGVRPREVGLGSTWDLECRFLEFAISLAERDLR